jgi:hypothetical protein
MASVGVRLTAQLGAHFLAFWLVIVKVVVRGCKRYGNVHFQDCLPQRIRFLNVAELHVANSSLCRSKRCFKFWIFDKAVSGALCFVCGLEVSCGLPRQSKGKSCLLVSSTWAAMPLHATAQVVASPDVQVIVAFAEEIDPRWRNVRAYFHWTYWLLIDQSLKRWLE